MFRTNYRAIQESFWYRPAIHNAIALLMAVGAVAIDSRWGADLSILGVAPISLSRTTEILAALAGAVLTMTTITFSGILVVLTTYSSQFSPRVLQDFIASRAIQHVLALFSGGVTYCIFALLIVSEEKTYDLLATPSVAVLWCLVAIAAFIFLLNHTASWLQVNNLIGFIAAETHQTIADMRGRKLNECRRAVDESDDRWTAEGAQIKAARSGYTVLVDMEALLRKAAADKLVVRLETTIGNFVVEDMPIMTLLGGKADEVEPERYRSEVRIDIEPRNWQDIGFGMRKIAEIGLRAISPSINDPYTAATSIHYLTALLVKLSRTSVVRYGVEDDQGELRLLSREPGFEQYLLRAFQELRRYGAEDNTTLVTILTGLGWIARMGDEQWHDLLWEFGADTYRLGCRSADLLEAEQGRLIAPLKDLACTVSREQDLEALLGDRAGS